MVKAAVLSLLLLGFSVQAEADFLNGRSTVFVRLSQPGGGAGLGELNELALVIGSKVTPPKQTHEQWLEDLPTLSARWKPHPVGDDKGSAGPGGGGFQVISVGGDVGGKADKCYQLLTPVLGDFSITCQVTCDAANADGTKAGLIFRDGPDAGAANVAMVTTRKECRMQFREKAGNDTGAQGGAQSGPSVLLRLERQGGTFRGASSLDGHTWVNRSRGTKIGSGGLVGFVVAGKAKTIANFAIVSAKGMVTEEGNVVMLEKDEYRVVESGKTVTLTVWRLGDGKGNLKVPWTANSGTAEKGKDFTGASGDLVWKDGETGAKKFTIAIVSNELEEKDKLFSVSLGTPEGAATLGLRQARVVIVDDDGPGRIRFQSSVVCVPDSSESVAQIIVMREQGKRGAVDVSYGTRAGTAKAGEKYKDVNGTLRWDDGDDKPKTIKVPIIWPATTGTGNPEDLLVSPKKSAGTTKADAKKAATTKKASEEE